ncbi:MAG: DUF692 domain-containing protein, partial [Cyanobacteria bacterium PR.023]|nr:DUF692 domain-containing protein [Cyanobacteria bacterium PR.023]
GFRPELARFIEQQENVQFVEIIAEDFMHLECVPQALRDLQKRGVTIIPHSLSLSVGGAEPVAVERIEHLNSLAQYFDSPFVSDHIAFVRAGNIESGHLLPVRRTEANLAVVCQNVHSVKAGLSVPFVLENIATTFDWPDNEMDEATFVTAVLEQTDSRLLLDVSNLFANSHNLKFDAIGYLQSLPLERLEYVHMAGGIFKNGLYHDSHCHSLKEQSLKLLSALKGICSVPRVMLERDDSFPSMAELVDELEAIANA